MPSPAVSGAMMTCSFGMSPSTLNVVRPTVTDEGRPAANVMDVAPMVNIPPFGMCTSLANPAVAAATAAALGVLTPMPCTPVPVGTWSPLAPTTLVDGAPALVQGAILPCAFGGVMTVTVPGTATTQVS